MDEKCLLWKLFFFCKVVCSLHILKCNNVPGLFFHSCFSFFLKERRTRISEKLRKLEDLVPNVDKVYKET